MIGTGPFAAPLLRALHVSEHAVAQVVCKPPRGRSGGPPAPVAAAAEALGLPLWTPESVNLPQSQSRLAELAADLLVVCDYGEILQDATLRATRLGGINLHGSLLPRYRGAAPVQWAVLNGEAETGATVIQMTPGLDAGPILGAVGTPIGPDETAGELEERLALLGAPLAVEVVAQLAAGAASPRPQDKASVTRAPRLRKADGQIDWSLPALALKNRVRGLQPWPRAFTLYADSRGGRQRLAIDRVGVRQGGGAPGEVLALGEHLLVATGDGVLEVQDVQPAGKRRMRAAEWLRGSPLAVGDVLGAPPR